MGDLGTAHLGGDAAFRARCCCGAWYDRTGDGAGAWDYPSGLVLPAGYCKPCAILRYDHGGPRDQGASAAPAGPSRAPSRPGSPYPASEAQGLRSPQKRTTRRRSDV
jgi:hypothetical protein